ncbi:MAG: hypothetical protein ACRDF6_14005 [bacterium]
MRLEADPSIEAIKGGTIVTRKRKRPGNTPAEQQQRSARDVPATRRSELAVSGPGTADIGTAPGGLDRPESGTKGMAQTRGDEGPLSDANRLAPRPRPDTEAFPGERRPEEEATGSQTGTVGGGGGDAHNPSPVRATSTDDVPDSNRKRGEEK